MCFIKTSWSIHIQNFIFKYIFLVQNIKTYKKKNKIQMVYWGRDRKTYKVGRLSLPESISSYDSNKVVTYILGKINFSIVLKNTGKKHLFQDLVHILSQRDSIFINELWDLKDNEKQKKFEHKTASPAKPRMQIQLYCIHMMIWF